MIKKKSAILKPQGAGIRGQAPSEWCTISSHPTPLGATDGIPILMMRSPGSSASNSHGSEGRGRADAESACAVNSQGNHPDLHLSGPSLQQRLAQTPARSLSPSSTVLWEESLQLSPPTVGTRPWQSQSSLDDKELWEDCRGGELISSQQAKQESDYSHCRELMAVVKAKRR